MRCDHPASCAVCREGEARLAREWQDSILLHEQKRDDEHRLRDGLERRAEKAEAEAEAARLSCHVEELQAEAFGIEDGAPPEGTTTGQAILAIRALRTEAERLREQLMLMTMRAESAESALLGVLASTSDQPADAGKVKP